MKNLNSFRRARTGSNIRMLLIFGFLIRGVLINGFFPGFTSFAAAPRPSVNQPALTIQSQSFDLDLNRETARFSKGIEIISGPVKINAASLIKKKISPGKHDKIIEVMQLSGNPVKVIIQEKLKHQLTTLFARKVKFIPSEGRLTISQQAKLSINVGRIEQTRIEANQIKLALKDNKITRITATGKPLKYQLQPESGKKITSTAKKLHIDKMSEQVFLYQAEVRQGGDKFQAGEIIIDGKTGNFSASAGDAKTPSISIDLKNLPAANSLMKPVSDIGARLSPASTKENNIEQQPQQTPATKPSKDTKK